jgi:hypothetical protein
LTATAMIFDIVRAFLSVDALRMKTLSLKVFKILSKLAKDVVFPAEDKKEEVMFMNRSVNYFAKKRSVR